MTDNFEKKRAEGLVLASSSSTCMVNSPIRFMALSSSACTGSPLRCLSEASIPPIAFSRHCSSRKISTPNWRDRSAPARHAKAADLTLARHIASPSGPLGKTWTSQARHLPQAHQQQLSSQNYRSCSGPPWTLRLSQFCVQGNRVRLIRVYGSLGGPHSILQAGLVFCPPAEHREPMSGLAIPFSMWQCAGHGDAAGPGFVR